MLTVEVNNIEYTELKSVTSTRSLEDALGSFSFTVAPTETGKFPFKKGDFIRIYADKQLNAARPIVSLVFTGYIFTISRIYNAKSNIDEITCSGFSKTADLIHSTLDRDVLFGGEFVASISLEKITKKVIEHLYRKGSPSNILKLETKVESIELEPFKQDEIVSASIGEGAFDFLERYARKRQVILTVHANGNLYYSRGGRLDFGHALTMVQNGANNNITEGSFSLDDTDRFRRYSVRSENYTPYWRTILDLSATNIVDNDGVETDTDIRPGRQWSIIAESTSNDDQCELRARWEAVVRRGRSQKYRATVAGNTYKNRRGAYVPWEPGRPVRVKDEFADIDAILLQNTVTWSYDLNKGETSTIECVPLNTYDPIFSIETKEEKEINKMLEEYKPATIDIDFSSVDEIERELNDVQGPT
jgi:prophage tail gpP-like protein